MADWSLLRWGSLVLFCFCTYQSRDEIIVYSHTCKTHTPTLFLLQLINYDYTGSTAPVGTQDTHSVAGCLLLPTPQSDIEAVREVYPPPYSQCLHHVMLWGLLFSTGQFQAQAVWPGIGGCTHPTHWLTQRGEAWFRTGDHTWTRRTWWEQTQVRTQETKHTNVEVFFSSDIVFTVGPGGRCTDTGFSNLFWQPVGVVV